MKNPNALFLYKQTVAALVDSHSDVNMREFYFQNFLELYSANQSIPPGILLESLIQSIRKSELSDSQTYHINSVDFDFFDQICKHPNLQLKHVVLLLDLLSMIYL